MGKYPCKMCCKQTESSGNFDIQSAESLKEHMTDIYITASYIKEVKGINLHRRPCTL